MEIFASIADERRTMADLLSSLTDEQLQTPSLCPPWTVHEVGAHVVVPLQATRWDFLAAFAACRGNFDRTIERMTARWAVLRIGELVNILRSKADHRFAPPGAGPVAPLTDLIVHGLDVRRPLGIPRRIPEDRTRAALDFLVGKRALGFVKSSWLPGLRLEATALDWAHGSGALVRGQSDLLLLALTGRRAVLDDLDGDGVAILRQRFG